MLALEGIDPGTAQRIVARLRVGDPPQERLRELTVGRDREVTYFEHKLDEIALAGLSEVKFISAGYGAGKTHFLDLLAQLALDRGFAVSKVDLDSRGTRFDHFEEVYAKLIRGIMTRDQPQNALEGILEAWAGRQGGRSDGDVYADLRSMPGLPVTLRTALFEYGRAVASGDSDIFGLQVDLLAWLSGEKLTSRQRNRLRITAPIGPSNASEMLHGILEFIRAQGFAGFVVLLDEAEAITSLQRLSSRDAANENIRSIIDNAGKSPGFYFVFATTPSFLDPNAPKSAATYQALWRRIRDPLGGASTSMERTIIDLHDLTEEQFVELALRVKHLVELAYGGSASTVSDDHIGQLAGYVRQRSGDQLSTLVRSVVVVMLQAQQDPAFDFLGTYPFLVEEQIDEFRRELTDGRP